MPPAILKAFSIEADRAGPEYLEQIGCRLARLTFNVKPEAGSYLLPLNHQRLLQAVDSLGQHVEPRWFYRQMYRHFEWDPLAQLSPSIDIYREQSARPRWPAFEIYRGLSIRRTRSLTREQTI